MDKDKQVLLERIAEFERELALAISEREALCDEARKDERERCLKARPITTAAIPPGEPGYNRAMWLHEVSCQEALDEWETNIRALEDE